VLRGLEKLEREGFRLRYPDTRVLSGGLYELRVGAKDIARTFFAFAVRTQAGLTKDDVAERMGISPPEITRLEDHALCANADTLQRYAQACGVKLKLSFS